METSETTATVEAGVATRAAANAKIAAKLRGAPRKAGRREEPKEYRALSKAPTFRFEEREGGAGVREILVDSTVQFGFLHVGWAAPLIRVAGVLYVADEVLRTVGGDFPEPSLKYGPGGRRRFVRVTDEVIDRLGRAESYRSARNVRERARAIEVAAFADALIGLL